MKLDNINISELVENTKIQLKEDTTLAPSLKVSLELILMVILMLTERLGLHSKNSSIPPSEDPNRKKKPPQNGDKPAGGQKGHKGITLTQTDSPDEVKTLFVERDKLPQGNYHEIGFIKRQVVDIDISKIITEYRAQIIENERGKQFIADFPDGVNNHIQYGSSIKAHAVYLSQYQLLPYNRIEEYFNDQLDIPISAGSLFNFNKQAFDLVTSSGAQAAIKRALRTSMSTLHVDETGINIDGKRCWLHGASDLRWTYFFPHKKRGKEAMDDADILAHFQGILCHDHWKPYYHYTDCEHALCNAHHLRELERAWEHDDMQWAKAMQGLLTNINKAQIDNGFIVDKARQADYRLEYQKILADGDIECPPPDEKTRKQGQRGRLKRTKSRALLERLRNFEDDTLRFMAREDIPFTNNQGERDIRMTKVHQKISGCFRSEQGAEMFCLIRSYLSTCRKQNISASEALNLLFKNQLPNIFTNQAAE